VSAPALEDKIVQRATVAILNSIYEEVFLGFSYERARPIPFASAGPVAPGSGPAPYGTHDELAGMLGVGGGHSRHRAQGPKRNAPAEWRGTIHRSTMREIPLYGGIAAHAGGGK
jgi:hypothetical protein